MSALHSGDFLLAPPHGSKNNLKEEADMNMGNINIAKQWIKKNKPQKRLVNTISTTGVVLMYETQLLLCRISFLNYNQFKI